MRGELIEGRYRLEERLGEGGMGEVWSALDVRMMRPVAAKLVRTVPGMDPAQVEQRFTHEVRSAANLPHRHTVTVHDCGETVLADLYSLGCLLYEGLAGRPPFTSAEPYALLYQQVHEQPRPLPEGRAPAALTDLVMHLLAKDPAHRPPDAATVVHGTDRLLAAHRRPGGERSEGDLDARRAKAEKRLAEIEHRAEQLRLEAEELRGAAEREARRTVETARRRAEDIVADAHAEAGRIRGAADAGPVAPPGRWAGAQAQMAALGEELERLTRERGDEEDGIPQQRQTP